MLRVVPGCTKCGVLFEAGDLLALHKGSASLAIHAVCPKDKPAPQASNVLLSMADDHIKAQAEVIRHSDTEIADLRRCLEMFVGNCPACKGTGKATPLVNGSFDPVTGEVIAELFQACEPCATAIALLRDTEAVDFDG
jgi:hypothetical protein